MKNILIIFALLFAITSKAQEMKFGKVSKQEVEEKFYPLDSTADAAYLLKKRKTSFKYDLNEGFIVVTEYHERIKIYTKEGLDYATKKINYYKPKTGKRQEINGLKAYTFNLEDNDVAKLKLSKKDIFDERLNKYRGQKKITFPNVKEGSVIDVKYTLKSPFWSIKPLNFQYGIPVINLDYTVKIPEYFLFNKTSRGYFNVPLKEASQRDQINFGARGNLGYTQKIYTFNKKNIPALNDREPYAGVINNYRGGMEFELSGTRFPQSMYKNYATNWVDVCKNIYDSKSFGEELKKTGYYKNDLTPIIAAAKTNYEKAALIFQFVKSKIKWNDYNGKYTEEGVKTAYKEGVGNVAEINLVLTSMLRSSGLDANPVLVSTKNNGIPLFPTLDGFNYIIAKVNFPNGKYVLLDATDKYSLPNVLPHRALNWYGREIFKGGSSKEVNLVPTTHSKKSSILHAKIDELGEVSGMYRKSLSGHSAMYYRKSNNSKKEEEMTTSLEEDNNIEVEDFKVVNMDILGKPVNQTLKFTSEDLIEEINGKLYFTPFFFLAEDENPFKSEERHFPVDFGVPWKEQATISITIPEGYTVESSPKTLAIGLPENLGVFKYMIGVQGNKIKVSSVTQFNSHLISPQHYTALRDFYKQLVEKQTEKIVLVKSNEK